MIFHVNCTAVMHKCYNSTTKVGILKSKNPWSECNPLWGQRSHKGQTEVNLSRNVLSLPNLVIRTPDQSVIRSKVIQRSICSGMSPRVKIRNDRPGATFYAE